MDEFVPREVPHRNHKDDPTDSERNVSKFFGIMFLGVGVIYLLGGESRFAGSALESARNMAPWWVWGILFIVMAVAILSTVGYTWHWMVLAAASLFDVYYSLNYLTSAKNNSGASFAASWIFFWLACGLVWAAVARNKASANRELERFIP